MKNKQKIFLFVLVLSLGFHILLNAAKPTAPTHKTVVLEPDKTFGKNTDFESIFFHRFKRVTVAPDGRVYVSNGRENNIHIFDKNGTLVKTFGQKGLGPGDVLGPTTLSILDNRYLVVNENPEIRKISLFSLDGEFINSFRTPDYILNTIALKDNKIAFYTSTSEYQSKHIIKWNTAKIYIMDIRTKQKRLVHTQRYDQRKKCGRFHEEVFILRAKAGNLLVGFSYDPMIHIYSPSGVKIRSFPVNIKPLAIDNEMREKLFQISLQRASENLVYQKALGPEWLKILKKNKSKTMSEYPPFFYLYCDIQIDTDGSIYVLKHWYPFPKWIFQKYTPNGTYKGDIELKAGKSNLAILPRGNRTLFDGYFYGVFEIEREDDTYFELLKLKFSNTKKEIYPIGST